MTLQQYYNKLDAFDWFYEFSDSLTNYSVGLAREEALRLQAQALGIAYLELYDAFKKWAFSGPTFGSPRQPKPPKPQA